MARRFTFQRKKCQFCRKKVTVIDFKDTQTLQKFLTPWTKMRAGRDTGTCAKHQRRLSEAIKRARYMALLPYVRR